MNNSNFNKRGSQKFLGKNGIIQNFMLHLELDWGFKLSRDGNFCIIARMPLKKIVFHLHLLFFHMLCMYTHIVKYFPTDFWGSPYEKIGMHLQLVTLDVSDS